VSINLRLKGRLVTCIKSNKEEDKKEEDNRAVHRKLERAQR